MHRRELSESALFAELARIMACPGSPVAALLELTRSCAGGDSDTTEVAVLTLDPEARSWSLLAATDGFHQVGLDALTPGLDGLLTSIPIDLRTDPVSGWANAQPIQDGQSSVVRLHGSGQLLGVLVVLGCPPALLSTAPYSVATALTMCLSGGIIRENARVDGEFVHRSSRAIRRLFDEGAQARDVEEAGAVLARVAAEAFGTERAGMYVVDADGLISFAVGVGISAELSDELATALVGKVAAESPVWQTLERIAGPSLVDDASRSDMRPGGFVQTLGFASYAAIPLLSATGPLGMVICGEASTSRTWTSRERQLATQFALEGALIIDAARLRASERAQLARITYEAFHDGLTGVPNRSLLIDRLDRELASATERDSTVAMLLLDLDDFKQVNDTLGHRYGDELLREVANRLSSSLRGTDMLARLGGDEFAILISEDASVEQAHAMAARINSLLSTPVNLDGVLINAVASIGIAVFPKDAATPQDLMQRADIAMYAAKASGNGPTNYQPSQDDSTVDKLTLYTELRQAIAEGGLALRYQPKLDLHHNTINGVEALVRWEHPRRGWLAPDEFLPMAESTGLIHSLTTWVLREALRQWAEWDADGVTLDLAVNVSARSLLDLGLLSQIADLVRDTRAAQHLIIEITETAVMLSPKDSAHTLSAIRDLGVRVSMDDFGTGYSSLALLGQLPLDELKVDRLLVQDVEVGDVNSALIQAVVGVGHRLGLAVVAEGIETAQTLQAVRDLGCDLGQGYFISRPVPADEVRKLVRVRRLPFPAPAVPAVPTSNDVPKLA